jgi:hypothetical protein
MIGDFAILMGRVLFGTRVDLPGRIAAEGRYVGWTASDPFKPIFWVEDSKTKEVVPICDIKLLNEEAF